MLTHFIICNSTTKSMYTNIHTNNNFDVIMKQLFIFDININLVTKTLLSSVTNIYANMFTKQLQSANYKL